MYGNWSGAYRVLVGKTKGKIHLEDLSLDGKIILKPIFKKWNSMAWTGLILLKIG
jgi:hypothetical protein